jgi:dUTP pyrophosphatase
MFHETDGILAEIQEMDKENEMILNIMLDEGAIMPDRGHAADAGMDLMTPKRVVVPAHGSANIDTGVHVEIPEGYFGKLESKSGLNVKHSVVSLGGVIDSGYTGSIVVKLYNISDEDYVFNAGDKVVQMIIQPCVYPKLYMTRIFKETERGNGGFGSTGR